MINVFSPRGSFELIKDFVGAGSAVAYSAGDIVSGNAQTQLLELDFSSYLDYNGKYLIINTIETMSENALLTADLYLFNEQITVSDNATFAPTYAQMKTLEKYFPAASLGESKTSTTVWNLKQGRNLSSTIELNSNRKLFLAIVTTGAYTPKNSENYRIKIQGQIL